MKTGIELIKSERTRQIEVEWWTLEHDKGWDKGLLGRAASCYETAMDENAIQPPNWPWDKEWWKPKSRVKNLVRAGALYLAQSDKSKHGNDKIASDHWFARVMQVADEIDRLNNS